jgi:UDP-N-acetylglucosamine--N-acetylmuramyl-(pentapeptide) pyrophosphoryl-undecaprenol N-acetylglucosamine transferase
MTQAIEHISRVIISGGGTGGHIFPAIAIANEIKSRNEQVEILFVGAEGKMEMTRIPAAGYEIIGLPISGFQRRFTFSNFILPFKIIISLLKARRAIKRFNPQLVIGVGGYASGPTLKMAGLLGIPTAIQEQNSFPGKTNVILSSKANVICTAYDGLEQFFPKEKIQLTGNPVRSELGKGILSKEEACEIFNLTAGKATILILGGSLGAKTLNDVMLSAIKSRLAEDVQIIWQCGKFYFEQMETLASKDLGKNIKLMAFISRMDAAYEAADVIISRAGALSVSELCLLGKPVILVPSPNVSEDHQTKNAMSLVGANAALLVKDSVAINELMERALSLLSDRELSESLSRNILTLAKPNATRDIVNECEKLVNR